MPRLDLLANLDKPTVPEEKRLNLFVPMGLQNQKIFSNISQSFYSYKVAFIKISELNQFWQAKSFFSIIILGQILMTYFASIFKAINGPLILFSISSLMVGAGKNEEENCCCNYYSKSSMCN